MGPSRNRPGTHWSMIEPQDRIVAWVAAHVMPHEPRVRAWLRRAALPSHDIDDLIQEAYCKLSALRAVDHIQHPAAYFLLIVRNLLTDSLRRSRVVRIEAIQEMDSLALLADEPTPEDITAGRRELARVQALIEALPDGCRQVIELRKIHGLSQREIAARLAINEARVEHLAVRGMKLLMAAMAAGQAQDSTIHRRTSDERSPNRRRD